MFKPPFTLNPENGIIGDTQGSVCKAYHNVNTGLVLCKMLNEHAELKEQLRQAEIMFKCNQEVIRFCTEDLEEFDARDFMQIWSNADWDTLKELFPEALPIVYAADPLWDGWKNNAE